MAGEDRQQLTGAKRAFLHAFLFVETASPIGALFLFLFNGVPPGYLVGRGSDFAFFAASSYYFGAIPSALTGLWYGYLGPMFPLWARGPLAASLGAAATAATFMVFGWADGRALPQIVGVGSATAVVLAGVSGILDRISR